MRNVIPKFQSCRLNGVATIEQTYMHYIHIDTNILPNLGNTSRKKFSVIDKGGLIMGKISLMEKLRGTQKI